MLRFPGTDVVNNTSTFRPSGVGRLLVQILLLPHLAGYGRSYMRPCPRFSSHALSSKHEIAYAEMQLVGEAGMAGEQDYSLRWTLDGQNLGQDGPRQPCLPPSPHLEQSGERGQAEARHPCPLKMP